MAAFVEWVTDEVLEPVDHRQYVWTIPRVLRPAFRRDRRLLGDLARCAWKTLRQYFQAALGKESVPGAIVAIQSYGDTLNFHPLCGAPHKACARRLSPQVWIVRMAPGTEPGPKQLAT